jgi:membrane-associated phospholipid phosphatase
MEEAYNDIHATLDPLKASLHRPRPYVEHPDIVTVPSGVPTDGPNSFPSAHAVYGVVMAGILAELDRDPGQKALFRARARP